MSEDNRKRSIIKTFSWRVIATTDTILIAWLVVGDMSMAVTVGGIEFFTKILIYYAHERFWARIKQETGQ